VWAELRHKLRTAGSAAIDYWLPESVREPGGAPYHRARLAVYLAWIIIGSGLSGIFVRVSVGSAWLALPIVGVLAGILIGMVRLKRGGAASTLGHLIAGGLCLAISLVNLASAASLPGPIYASLLVPMVATVLLGPRSGIAWGALSIVTLATSLWLRALGYEMLIRPTPDAVAASELAAPVICAGAALWLTYGSEVLKRRTLDELALAKDRAEAATRTKTRFLANTSHELRTPLNGVLGIAQLIESGELEPTQRERVRKLRQSATLLLVLLNDLIDSAQAEQGNLELREEWIELEPLIREVHELLEPEALRKGVALHCEADPNIALLTDGGRLRQILFNLVGNALKFTAQGSVRIIAQAKRRDEESFDVTIRVEDTGIGISKQVSERIFERFTQADAKTSRRYGGAGLGLSISRDIAERMGGTLTVESDLGEGACFECAFSCPGRSAPALSALSATPGIADKLGLDVMIADDNPTNRLVTEGFLDLLGCRTILAHDGREALRQFLDIQCDVILMDCLMPELDGYQAAQSIRKLEADSGWKRTPIVAVTANRAPGERSRCLAAGMDDYLPKPFTLDQLALCISKQVGRTANAGLEGSRSRSPSEDLPEALQRLHQLSEAGEDFALRVIEGWKVECEQAFAELASAVRDDDIDLVRVLAHTRKGACLNVGAESAAESFAKLEQLAQLRRSDEFKACLLTCQSAFELDAANIDAMLRAGV